MVADNERSAVSLVAHRCLPRCFVGVGKQNDGGGGWRGLSLSRKECNSVYINTFSASFCSPETMSLRISSNKKSSASLGRPIKIAGVLPQRSDSILPPTSKRYLHVSDLQIYYIGEGLLRSSIFGCRRCNYLIEMYQRYSITRCTVQ